MAKGIKTEGAAYEAFPGMTAEEAAKKGYVVVEGGEGLPVVYGRYLNTETGAALETLTDEDKRTATPVGGPVVPPVGGNDKGALVNPDDPVVHGTADNNPHEDGAEPNPTKNDNLDVTGYTPGDELKPKKG